jgi:hypothetical protein
MEENTKEILLVGLLFLSAMFLAIGSNIIIDKLGWSIY